MTRKQAIQLVLAELGRAERKYPGWPEDLIHAAAVVQEEAGELVRECVHGAYSDKCDWDAVDREAIHTAATALRFLMSRKIMVARKSRQVKS